MYRGRLRKPSCRIKVEERPKHLHRIKEAVGDTGLPMIELSEAVNMPVYTLRYWKSLGLLQYRRIENEKSNNEKVLVIGVNIPGS